MVMRICALALCLVAAACASNSDFERLRSDVNELRRESNETRKDIDSLKDKTAGTVKEDSFSAVKESQAEMTARIAELSSSLQELRGRFEENRYFSEKSLKDQAGERELLKAQLSGLDSQVKSLKEKMAAMEIQFREKEMPKEQAPAVGSKPEEQGAGKDAGQPKEEADEKKSPVDEKARLYEAAYQAFKDKKYPEARTKFDSFIKQNPKSELTDNAHFWIAESYYAEKDYENSILAYETLLKKFPESEKSASALMKQGFAFVEIGDIKTGKIILNKVIEKYPESREADLSKKKIAEVEKKPAAKKK